MKNEVEIQKEISKLKEELENAITSERSGLARQKLAEIKILEWVLS